MRDWYLAVVVALAIVAALGLAMLAGEAVSEGRSPHPTPTSAPVVLRG